MTRPLLASTLLALALGGPFAPPPAHAATAAFLVGSHLGLDFYSLNGTSLSHFATSPGEGFFTYPEPGLRLGVVTADRRFEISGDVGITVLSSQGSSISSVGASLEGDWFAGGAAGISPYLGAHVGVANLDFGAGESSSLSRFGAQAGVRHVVSQGHGSVRLELRGGIVRPEGSDDVTEISVRIGYDLWML